MAGGDLIWLNAAPDAWREAGRDTSHRAPIMRTTIATALAVLAFGVLPAAAQVPAVQRVVAVARPPRYEGPCPARFEFIGTIFVNYPSIVTYRWERSDRAVGPVQSVTIRGGGMGVDTTWQLGGAPGRVFSGSETLHVLSPVDMYSNPAAISLVCR